MEMAYPRKYLEHIVHGKVRRRKRFGQRGHANELVPFQLGPWSAGKETKNL